MDLNDVTPENFFKNITFESDAHPGAKLKIPDSDFFQCAIMLKLTREITKLKNG